MRSKIISLVLGMCCLAEVSGEAANWPQWRGPFFDGSTTEKNLPAAWSTEEGVAWKTPLPGSAGSTPVIWNDDVFVTSPDASNLICLSAMTGKIKWQKEIAVGDRTEGRNNMSSPSAVTDGKKVIAMFGTGNLACYTVDGKELWTLNLAKKFGRFSIMWLYGSSPLLIEEKLYVQVLENNDPSGYPHALDDKPTRESYLLCLEADTGKELWRHIRKTDAIVEAQESYASPIPMKVGSETQMVVIGGDYATGHDLQSGRELWRQGGLNERHEKFWRLVPSPTPGDGMVFVSAPRRDPVLAIKPGREGVKSELLWSFKEFPSDCPTPLYFDHQLFVLDGDKYMMTCLDPKTGEKKWQGEMGVREIFRSSPTGADGKIYCVTEKGTVVVLSAGPEFKVLATIKHNDEPVRGSIAVANGHLFMRGGKNLWCIGPK